jgi:tetratricopeptide (TPR) repeat protein
MRLVRILAMLLLTAVIVPSYAAKKEDEKKAPPANSIDAATGKILTEAIEALNAEKYSAASAAIAKIKLDGLSPYERSRVEQILATIDHSQDKYASARGHLNAAITAGGLNEEEVSQTKYQIAQLFLAEEKWKEGAAALEDWFRTATKPNSAAYYLLAVAYYQQDLFAKALAPAQKAVDLAEKPQESWIQLVLALHLQQEHWKEAVPLLNRLINMAPDKKTYWQQLSSVYGQLEQYSQALAVTQLAYSAGLLDNDSDVRRLADLLMFNDVPYRCGQILEDAMAKKIVTVDAKSYEKLANCWIAAREFSKSIEPLSRAAEMSGNGNLYVRLGEVQVQRSNWDGASAALGKGIKKGGLKDTGNAQLMLGIALYNQKKLTEAEEWFKKAKSSDKSRQTAEGYLQLIQAQAAG